MPIPRTTQQARKMMESEAENARRRAENQEGVRRGYKRTGGFEPARRDRNVYKGSAEREAEANDRARSGLPPAIRMTGEAKDEEVKRRAREGRVIDNSVFYK